MDCLFCGIVAGKIPAKKVYEDDVSVAFLDINPRNPGHTLVIPKKHYQTLLDMPEAEAGRLFQSVKKVAAAAMTGTKADGISIAQSNGPAAGQVVSHMHFHVIPRFANEGPVGLESMLAGKRFDEQTMEKIVQSIKAGMGAARTAPAPKPAPVKENKVKEEGQETQEINEEKKEDVSFDF